MDWKLSPNAIVEPQELRSHIKRVSAVEDEALIVAANWTTAIMESRTRRRLRERLYVSKFTIACTMTADSDQITGTTFSTKLKVGMDVLGTKVAYGSRVKTVTSDVAAVLDKKATAAGAETLTFGSDPLFVDGDGGVDILLPESPCEEVYTVKSRDRDGLKESLDTTGITIDKEAGIISLPYGWEPVGTQNIEIECRAGYRPRSETDQGHEDWSELFGLALGISEVLFQRYSKSLGLATETMAGTEKVKLPEIELPPILERGLKMFERGIE